VHVTSQLSIFLANKPGTFASVCEVLARAKVNIFAVATSDSIDHSVVRMIVDDPGKAVRILEDIGALVVETDVIMIEGPNKPGSMAQIMRTLADAKINIEYAYCATPPLANRGLLVIRPTNVASALKTLNLKKDKPVKSK
jgi:hypothetical protein